MPKLLAPAASLSPVSQLAHAAAALVTGPAIAIATVTARKPRLAPCYPELARGSRAVNQPVQTLRGLACIFLVAFHAVGSQPDRGLMMADGTVLRHLADTFIYLRQPAFAFVAGLVYSFRSVQPGQHVAGFVLGKARRLLVPMLVVSSLQFAVEAAAKDHDFSQILWLPVWPLDHFWFLEAIFTIFVLVAILDHAGVLLRPAVIAAAILATAAMSSLNVVTTHFLALDGVLDLLPFFLLGVCFGRFGDPMAFPGGAPIAWLLVAVGVAIPRPACSACSIIGSRARHRLGCCSAPPSACSCSALAGETSGSRSSAAIRTPSTCSTCSAWRVSG